jgi:hypothetical protein
LTPCYAAAARFLSPRCKLRTLLGDIQQTPNPWLQRVGPFADAVPIAVLDSPVFLCGHRKSGTTMLVCLFDCHPELLTYPCDSGFFYKVFPACLSSGKEESARALVDHTIRHCLRKEMANVESPELFDVDAVAARFEQLVKVADGSPKSLLKSLFQAYGELCGQEPDRWKACVEKTTSTEIYALEIADWFPKAKFIHLIRDPRDNYAALKSGWQSRYRLQEEEPRGLLQSLIDRGGLGTRLAQLNRAILGADRYLIVRFEDLARAPEATLKEMSDFMGISYHPTLMMPSVNGIAWPGNNFDGQRFQGLSALNVGRWRERIEPLEAATIEFFMADVMLEHGYELTTTIAERGRAAADHYKWFNFSSRGRGTA